MMKARSIMYKEDSKVENSWQSINGNGIDVAQSAWPLIRCLGNGMESFEKPLIDLLIICYLETAVMQGRAASINPQLILGAPG
jgi:hypothetical protein